MTASIRVGFGPCGIAYGNQNLYVANAGTGFGNEVSVINTRSNKVTATIGVPTTCGIAYGQGKVLVTAGELNGVVHVIDAASNRVTATVPVGTNPAAVAYGNGNFYVTNQAGGTVTVIRASSNAVIATVGVGSVPAPIAYGSNGKVYVGNTGDGTVSVIDSASNAVTATIHIVQSATGIAYGGGKVYVANASVRGTPTLSVIDAATNRVIANVRRVAAVPAGVAYALGNVYVADSEDNEVFVVDGATNRLNPTPLEVGQAPQGVVYANHGTVYVTNSGDDTVSVIDVAPPAVTALTARSLRGGVNPTHLGFSLSEPADVRTVIERRYRGRNRVAATLRDRHPRGRRLIALPRAVRGRPGLYRARVRACDRAGHCSRPRRIAFRIAPLGFTGRR